MLVELMMRRATGERAGNSPVDGIRILALLPRRWRKDLRQATGEIVIRVHTDECMTNAQIRAEVTEILTDPAVNDWELVTCHTLAVGHHERKEGKS
ncbi:hypothetical protein [Streptosporangium sp. NPDC000396]|uniref:hypothetical protein n=1 Tax=Streptosporangium sp. NPDC000396 TaxID=3366185 RepID=UPI0036B601EE